MRLTPGERDRLLIFTAAELARARRSRGLLLNAPEATALIADAVCEAARDGGRLGEALRAGRAVLGPADVLPGVVDLVDRVDVEAGFDDGTRLVVVTDPFASPEGSAGPAESSVDRTAPPGVPIAAHLEITNTAGVPISITSHFHLFEVNPRLLLDREAAYGHRLALAAGASLRFAPQESHQCAITPIAGNRVIIGFAGLVDGPLDAPGQRELSFERARATGYLSTTWETS